MKAQNIIAIAAAVLFTSVSLFTTADLSAVHYNVNGQPSPSSEINGGKVIDLAPVNVHPSAAERRAATLMADVGAAGLATIPTLGRMGGASDAEQLNLIGSQLAMPYYSFGNKFGRISKE